MKEDKYNTNPFPGPRPYGNAGGNLYHRRDELEKKLTSVLRTTEFCLVFGPAGAGKSTILHAVVHPELERKQHIVHIHNEWHMAQSSDAIKEAVANAMKTSLPEIAEMQRNRILRLKETGSEIVAHTEKNVTLIFDQIDHLFAPDIPWHIRDEVLIWLISIAAPRSRDFGVSLNVAFGIREEFIGQLLPILLRQNIKKDFCLRIPRLRLSEVWKTACLAVPNWSEDKYLKEQIRRTAYHENSKESDPEVNAALAQIMLSERFETESRVGKRDVSLETTLRKYIGSAVRNIAGGGEAVGKLFHALSKSFVSGNQKRFCSERDLKNTLNSLVAEGKFKELITRLTEIKLLTRVEGESEAVYSLSHDSLCEVLESEVQLIDQDLRIKLEQERSDSKQIELARAQADVAASAFSSWRAESADQRAQVERLTKEQVGGILAEHERQLRAQREEHDRQIALLLVTQQQHVESIRELQRETVAGVEAKGEANQQGLLLAHAQQIKVAERGHEAQLRLLREQHRREVDERVAAIRVERDQQLRAQREEHDRQIALLLVSQQQQVEGIRQLGREEVARVESKYQAKEQSLLLDHTQKLDGEKQSFKAQIGALQEQHSGAVEKVTKEYNDAIRKNTTEREQAISEKKRELGDAVHAKTELEKQLQKEKGTAIGLAKKVSSGRTWLGLAAIGLVTLGGLMGRACWGERTQVQQASRLAQTLLAEQARCAQQLDGCGALTRSARRLAAAQRFLARDCVEKAPAPSGKRAPCDNPNRAASLLLEIPESERGQLPLWDEIAKQIVRRGRLRSVALDLSTIDQLDYSKDGWLLAYGSKEPRALKKVLLQDERAAGPTAVSSVEGAQVKSTERSMLWQNLILGQSEPRKFSGRELGLSFNGRDAERCADLALQRPWRAAPGRLIPIERSRDSRVLALTPSGIWLRDVGCRSAAGLLGRDDDWLLAEERLGPEPYHFAAVDDWGMYLVAASGSHLRAIAVPSKRHGDAKGSAAETTKGDEVFDLGLVRDLRDAQFRPGAAGRLAVGSENTISFWDLTAASRADPRDLHRFATDCPDAAWRRTWLGETDKEAGDASAACTRTWLK